MPLACSTCDAPHDFDLGPDDGTCVICGGDLIEDVKERKLVGDQGLQRAMVDTVSEALSRIVDQDHAKN